MRIKQLELHGFKSFMDRTVLELPLGVTAIVGPNGCGKSNIVDAMRWVLGEQSPKHLRGGAMEDVIFAGNAENGPLGMAEVSLLMERTDEDVLRAELEDGAVVGEHTLPPELACASEVMVTRRYFRSGESEYFINRVACRLKDITELFLGTGVGTKAYAIIEQGRVEQLVNAKPDEMRLFIEEAAGTTRFRARKIAAERKMERTRENLVRVQDVLQELDRQMATLQRQARRAEEYHRIKGELRQLDLRVMAGRQRVWSAQIDELHRRAEQLRDEESTLHAEVRRSQDAGDELRVGRHAGETRLREVEEHITAERLQAVEWQARIERIAERRRDLEVRAQNARVEGASLRERSDVLAAEVARLDEALTRVRDEQSTTTAEWHVAEARLAEVNAAGAPLEATVDEAKDALVEATAEEVRLRNLTLALQQRQSEIAGQRQRLEDEQRVLAERLRANDHEREVIRNRTMALEAETLDLTSRRAAQVEASQVLSADEAGQAADVERERTALTQLRSRAESLRELQARYEGCSRGVASLLGRDGAGAALLASVLRVPVDLERAVAAALGPRLGQLVVPDTTAALDAVRWLQEHAGGSATVIPREAERRAAVIVPPGRRLVDQLDVDPEHWALAEALLGGVLLAKDLPEALQLWKNADHAITVVTPDGQAVDSLGGVTGGSEPPLEETLLARAREVRELEGTVRQAEERLEERSRGLADVRARLAESQAAIAALDEQLQRLRLDRLAGEKDRERLEEERARISAALEVGALEVGGLAGAGGQVQSELAAVEQSRRTVEDTLVQRRATLARVQESLAGWRHEYATLEERRTRLAVLAAAASERHGALRAALDQANAALADVATRVESADRIVAETVVESAQLADEEQRVEAQRTVANGNVARFGEERTELLARIAAMDARITTDDHTLRAVHDRLDVLRAARGEVEIALAERRMSLQQIGERLAERYDLGLDALETVVLGEDGISEDEETLVETLRARLVRLGEVNPAALSELEEVRGRYEFLAQQRADLERSLDDLRQTITRLTRTSRARFDETFDAANEKLAEVFPKVFPRGTASLVTVPSEEGGEPGIEIVVQLAGKKLQSLSLLSGGEKALTATALVFSLFLIRPTPFCVLDEVDAPLDEANIGRFNGLVAEMAQSSQFVLITHNRRTMEVAETLYGITMEQAGISKVVSVRLSEAA